MSSIYKDKEENPSFQLGRFHFFSNFDSGNLGRIETLKENEVLPELKKRVSENEDVPVAPPCPKTRRRKTEEECRGPNLKGNFKCWTRPDCAGTRFENGNRTWFNFGMKVGFEAEEEETPEDWALRFNFQNLNKQAKLFSQGFSPVVCIDKEENDETTQWKRLSNIYYKTIDNQFYMSFVFNLSRENRYKTHYFAFTYPYSFLELEKTLNRFALQYENSPNIYFHKAIGTYSYENRPIYVLTISGMNGLTDKEESIPLSSGSSPKMFRSKKYVFISARVHPGETQSSFIMDGLLKMLLRENDSISLALRKKYVFKIIPMLNPDGVVRGHYRTDARGINLNRVYGDPDPRLHPSIFFAKKLILYAHFGKISDPRKISDGDSKTQVIEPLKSEVFPSTYMPSKSDISWYEMTETSRCSEGDESIADFSFNNFGGGANMSSTTGGKILDVEEEETSFFLSPTTSASSSNVRSTTTFSEAFKKNMDEDFNRKLECTLDGPEQNLFLYLDIHGHASKRGIFMYGNHFTDLDTKIDSMLLPKLVSLNCPNFDFPACNFTEKNMYLKDRHTGAGREGCGRVAVFKSTGLVYSYTLEANFNTGRDIKPVPNSPRAGSPSLFYDRPPKYTPSIYEDAGKAVAVAVLDLTDSNPWSRVATSSCKTMKGVKESIRRFIKTSEEHSVKNCESSPNGRLLRRRSAPPRTKKLSSESKTSESSSKMPRKTEKSSSSSSSTIGAGLSRPTSPTRPSSARTTRNKKNNKKSLIPSPNMVVEPNNPTASSHPVNSPPITKRVRGAAKKKKKVQKRKTVS
ncbi:cytosolic carboxypeptidase-like protein 5 [Lepeophtheirus salmonis]|uniref:cytosolic carboxypeptidase-like protein 5 n=1 Tax=Lepeophtheirus salmonis TaxID=72036 RepID=UPI001AE52E0D|nr:cytosolic carboxypeptidase-like protein 5 [Lepeophtheirus salmonis]XP_040574720.1 cytosolic carboxypeptidase-like protein 5 [Lepeophtheirus salmonis]XP_040574721.1 cytosolic carboxypeptidase-like protein 5 [Lepeophtheirus salmonis]